MTPIRGIGENIAFQNVRDLVEALKHKDANVITTRISYHEKRMLKRGFKASILSKQGIDVLHAMEPRLIDYNIIVTCLQLFCIGSVKSIVLYYMTYNTKLFCIHGFTVNLYFTKKKFTFYHQLSTFLTMQL
jgi:hypothetical protein